MTRPTTADKLRDVAADLRGIVQQDPAIAPECANRLTLIASRLIQEALRVGGAEARRDNAEALGILWLTTQVNPHRRPTSSADDGVTGWRLHAVRGHDREKFSDIATRRALCGTRAKYGWGMDLFIERRCTRCEQAAGLPQTAGTR